jgi:hypothetical protein
MPTARHTRSATDASATADLLEELADDMDGSIGQVEATAFALVNELPPTVQVFVEELREAAREARFIIARMRCEARYARADEEDEEELPPVSDAGRSLCEHLATMATSGPPSDALAGAIRAAHELLAAERRGETGSTDNDSQALANVAADGPNRHKSAASMETARPLPDELREHAQTIADAALTLGCLVHRVRAAGGDIPCDPAQQAVDDLHAIAAHLAARAQASDAG